MSEQVCPRCAGQRVTEKVRYTVEIDADGQHVSKQENYLSPCDHCGGRGWVS
ncbi:hypothetical protein [Kitasatospora mediocidica]|uniref:hypothetical protein n=1 Tax=Kitasatospora mediocidica TaxID=58352 RepID=UPI000AF6DC7A|nr:hypothetical protein [Kitasatospora mediocidica]